MTITTSTVAHNAGATCDGNGSATGTPLRITYFDGTATLKYVQLEVIGKHTRVESNAEPQISGDKKVLSYNPGTGYIQSISAAIPGKLTIALGRTAGCQQVPAGETRVGLQISRGLR